MLTTGLVPALIEISPYTTLDPAPGAPADPSELQQSVRFNSAVQEIEPQHVETSAVPFARPADHAPYGNPSDITPEELKALSKSLKACPLQERRMGIFAYEPYSLPVSRVSASIVHLHSFGANPCVPYFNTALYWLPRHCPLLLLWRIGQLPLSLTCHPQCPLWERSFYGMG
jgi:hypothetical protein